MHLNVLHPPKSPRHCFRKCDFKPALPGMDDGVRQRAPHRRAARPHHPPCPYPGDERRELPAQAEPVTTPATVRITPYTGDVLLPLARPALRRLRSFETQPAGLLLGMRIRCPKGPSPQLSPALRGVEIWRGISALPQGAGKQAPIETKRLFKRRPAPSQSLSLASEFFGGAHGAEAQERYARHSSDPLFFTSLLRNQRSATGLRIRS